MNKGDLLLANVIFFFLLDSAIAEGREGDAYEFNPDFVIGENKVDLKKFSVPGAIKPGVYNLSVYLNEKQIGVFYLNVKYDESLKKAIVCYNNELIKSLGIKNQKRSDSLRENLKIDDGARDCTAINELIPYLNYHIDFQNLALYISVPQMYLDSKANGSIDPAFWDKGISAGYVNYNATYNENSFNRNKSYNFFSMLSSGINIGLWQFRNNSNFNKTQSGKSNFNTINSYIQRPIELVGGNLVIGQYNTSGQYFDSVSFQGIQLSSDNRMLPNSQQGFAPEIKGIAQSTSVVEIKQRGVLLYQATVPQGPFLINDLYPTGFGGELDVTITGADGKIQKYSVPYSSVSQLLRPGLSRYSASLGELRNNYLNNKPKFFQGWYSLGLSNIITGYSGGLLSKRYQSTTFGFAVNTGLGAFSSDITNSFSKVKNDNLKGWSAKFNFSKLIEYTKTNLSLSTYRYSSRNYLNFNDASTADADNFKYYFKNQKSRFEVSLNQVVGDMGNIFLSGSIENYWDSDEKNIYYQAGYGFNYKNINIAFDASRVDSSNNKSEYIYSVSLNIPFGRENNYNNLTSSYTSSNNGKSQATVGLNGVTGESNDLTYGISSSYDENRSGYFSGSLTKTSTAGQLSVMGSKSKEYSQYSIGGSGSIVAHSGGITLGQYSSNSFVLVEAKNAAGAKIDNTKNVAIDRFGYAIIPYSNPYRRNEVSINPEGISENTEFKGTSKDIVPYDGSIVKVKFKTVTGYKAFIYSQNPDGEFLPIGAVVKNSHNEDIGVVGQSGVIYASGLEDSGVLSVAEAGFNSCTMKYDINSPLVQKSSNGIYKMNLLCIK